MSKFDDRSPGKRDKGGKTNSRVRTKTDAMTKTNTKSK
jgi:hypothetical protein